MTATHVRVPRAIRILTIAAMGVMVAACTPEPDDSSSVSIGTGSFAGNYRLAGHAIARIVNTQPGPNPFRVDTTTSDGSVSNLEAVLAGDVEFGLVQADHQHDAVVGVGVWQERGPQQQLRSMFSLFSEAVTLVAGADTEIRSIEGLRGMRVDLGPDGSGTRRNALEALAAAGIDWQNDIDAHDTPLDERLAKFMHGGLDAFFFTVGHPSRDLKFATLSERGARFVPLSNIAELLDANRAYSRAVVPASSYPRAHNPTDTRTVGVTATLVTSAQVPEELVFAVTRAVLNNLDTLRGYDPIFAAIAHGAMGGGLTAPLHPGALRAFREAGLEPPSP